MLLLDDQTAKRLKDYLRLKSDAAWILDMLTDVGRPTVVVNISGGVMQGASGNMPVDIYALDFEDVDTRYPHIEVEGSECYVYETCSVVDPKFIEHVIGQLDA